MTEPVSLNHIGFILDGNRRWAKAHGLPKLEGHKRGYDRLKDIAQACFDRDIKYVSAYIFSTENWNRETAEVNYLMKLALKMFERDMAELGKKNIKVKVLGTRQKLDPKLIQAIERVESSTANNTRATLCLCFNYGGRDEIVEATKKIVEDGIAPADINRDVVKANLYTRDIPDPDLIVRTGGEQRLSNFLLWGSAYSELMFVPQFWPDFDETSLDAAIAEYNKRKRNFGK